MNYLLLPNFTSPQLPNPTWLRLNNFLVDLRVVLKGCIKKCERMNVCIHVYIHTAYCYCLVLTYLTYFCYHIHTVATLNFEALFQMSNFKKLPKPL